MDDGHCGGALRAEDMDMAHDVMAEFGFFFSDGFEINVVEVSLHLVDLLLGNIESELFFGFGESEPKPSPGGVFALG